jgi:hypothetical protein
MVYGSTWGIGIKRQASIRTPLVEVQIRDQAHAREIREDVSGGMILPENRRSEIPFSFPGLFFRLFS